ncbi:MAG TPA: oxygen-independent coproporphyrinogen III oxidase [Pyrinomonadaceae bacterium]|jgi:oxygen-independent coproporphyrinogen-3 oxidase|nr:oxygen-independent coproporphyrinogen III oxidase [Pyrinomonadaceae bacterium]
MIETANELLKKYDVPGPRYTSYPTILHWETAPTPAEWFESVSRGLDEIEREGSGAAVYLHIPFCRSLCTYCGCNSRITQNAAVGDPYVNAVLKEWEMYLDALRREEPIPLAEMHLGGGTPTFLSPAELERMIGGILNGVRRVADSELSIESDPRVTTREHLLTLARLGFTRLSLGIQDFDPRVQRAVNRIQTEEQVQVVTEAARAAGFTSINYDLIYGLPFQTLASVEQTVEAVRRLRPERIAFYAYAHVPWFKPGQRHFTEEDLPRGDDKRALYELGRAMLEEAGYREVGMDHFALEGDSLLRAAREGTMHRNFMGYTPRHTSPLIGLGVSSISDSWEAFVQNEKVVEAYQERVGRGELSTVRGHRLTREDLVLRRHILNLMTRFRTDWSEPASFTPSLGGVAGRLIEPLRDGLVRVDGTGCQVTEAGRPFLRNICMAFDARIDHKADAARQFSRTV